MSEFPTTSGAWDVILTEWFSSNYLPSHSSSNKEIKSKRLICALLKPLVKKKMELGNQDNG